MAVPSHIGSNTQDSAAGLSLTFTVPAATTTGDFILVEVKQSENTSQRIWDDDGGGGNGYIQVGYNRSTGGRDQETAIYYKVATSGSEPNPTFTWASGITAEPMSGIMEVYRGVDTVTPIQGPSFSFQQNTPASTPPDIEILFPNTRVVVFQASTHDDITVVAPPTGYTLRSQIWNGTADDHRNNFSADIEIDTIGTYSPPQWQHTSSSNTPESHAYTIALNELQPIHITGGTATSSFNWGDNGLTILGDGFESTQGTGKVEFWSSSTGGTKITQTIDSWSENSITIDTVQSSLITNGLVYLVVTNDSGDVSGALTVGVGLLPYCDYITTLSPDHYWKFDNDYDDYGVTGPVRNATSGVIGTNGFTATTISECSEYSWTLTSVTDRREISDSPNMNVTINSKERTICTWVSLGGIQQSLGAIWKEGGGVQNLAFLVGIGNVLMAQLADVAGSRDNVQAISDIRLTPNRAYHILMRYSHLDTIKEFNLYLDGVKQSVTDGNPMTLGIFDSHSGDVTWGDPDNNLETGGTDIAYAGQEDALLAHFVTWGDNSIGVNAGGLDDDEIFSLFERGALPDITITGDTQINMQAQLDAYSGTTRPDAPLAIRVEPISGGGTLELIADNITFDDRVSIDIQFMGDSDDTLNWVLQNGASIDEDKLSKVVDSGSTINILKNVPVTVIVLDFDSVPIQNARVLLEAASGGTESVGVDIISGITDINGEITENFRYDGDQPVTGRVRRATTGTLYKNSDISAIITEFGLEVTIFLINDE